MQGRIPSWCFVSVLLTCLVPAPGGAAAQQRAVILATTTSTQDTGLLDVLVPRFEREHGIEVTVIAVGTGAALRMASTGNADVVLVHAPDAERRFVESGDLIEGRRVMHNDYVIVGPPDDPARVRGATSATGAMQAIAAHGTFISRGDDSGTHQQELTLWNAAGVDPESLRAYEETDQGMGATLDLAGQKGSYTLTDRGSYLALRKHFRLAIVFEGDPNLLNIYHVHVVNPARHPRANAAGARAFSAFLLSAPVQQAIGAFKRQEYGRSLFVPSALPEGTRK